MAITRVGGSSLSMLGRINTTFGTYQADLFESGLVAQIGPNSFAVWAAIKAHADFQTGIAWPSVRRLMALTGLASATVQKCLGTLEDAHLLRSDVRNKRRYYVARERLDVSLGQRVLCTVVVDYVPASMRDRLAAVQQPVPQTRCYSHALGVCQVCSGSTSSRSGRIT